MLASAGVILEGAARATSRGGRNSAESSELQKMVWQVLQAVKGVAESNSSPAVRCTAIEALLWAQVCF